MWRQTSGWLERPLCVSQEAAFEFATNVLDEVIALFPSHISILARTKCHPVRGAPARSVNRGWTNSRDWPSLGGDHVPVQVTSGQGLPFHEDIGRLQGEFIRRIDQHLTTKGRRMVGWDEILEGGLKTGSRAVVMAWRGASAVAGSTARIQDVVVALHPDYYLDNDTPLQRTYDYEPVPSDCRPPRPIMCLGSRATCGRDHVIAAEGGRPTFPRLCALAETGWTGRDGRNFADFSARLAEFRQRLELLGVAGGKP